jgi:hypothetical protein
LFSATNTNVKLKNINGDVLTVDSSGVTIIRPVTITSGGSLNVSGVSALNVLNVQNTSTFSGLATANGGLTVPIGQTLTSSGTLNASGANFSALVNANNGVIVTGNISGGTLSTTGTATIGGLLTANAGITVSGALNVSGATTLSGLTVQNASTMTGLLTANGGISSIGNISGASISGGTLSTSGTAIIGGLLSANAGITVSGNISGGSLTISGTGVSGGRLQISDPTVKDGSVQIQATTTLSGGNNNLVLSSVSGAIRLNNATTVSGNLTATGNISGAELTTTSNATIGGLLSANGGITVSGNISGGSLTISGTGVSGGRLTIGDPTVKDGSVQIQATTTLSGGNNNLILSSVSGAIRLNNATTVSGLLTANAGITVSGALNVSGASTLSGLTVQNASTMTGLLTANGGIVSTAKFTAGTAVDADRSNYNKISYFPTNTPFQLAKYGTSTEDYNIIDRSRMKPAAIFMQEVGPIRFTEPYTRQTSGGDAAVALPVELSFPITGVSGGATSELQYFTISGASSIICRGMIVTISGSAGGLSHGTTRYVEGVDGNTVFLGVADQPLFGGSYMFGETYYKPNPETFTAGSSLIVNTTANTGLFVGGKWGRGGADTSLTASGGLILGNYEGSRPGKISTAVGVNGLNITSANGDMKFFGETGGARLTVPQAAGTAVSVSGGLNVSGSLTVDTLTTGTGNVSLNGDVTIASGKSLTQNGSSNVTFGGPVLIANNTTSALNVSGLTTVSGLTVNNALTANGGITLANNVSLNMNSGSGAGEFTTATGNVTLNGPVRITNNTTSALNVSGLTTVSGLRVNNILTANGGINLSGAGYLDGFTVGGTENLRIRPSTNAGSIFLGDADGNTRLSVSNASIVAYQNVTISGASLSTTGNGSIHMDNTQNGTFRTGTGTVTLNGPVNITNNTATALNVSGLTTVSGLTVNNSLTANGGITLANNVSLNMNSGSGAGEFTTATGNVSLNGSVTISGKPMTTNQSICALSTYGGSQFRTGSNNPNGSGFRSYPLTFVGFVNSPDNYFTISGAGNSIAKGTIVTISGTISLTGGNSVSGKYFVENYLGNDNYVFNNTSKGGLGATFNPDDAYLQGITASGAVSNVWVNIYEYDNAGVFISAGTGRETSLTASGGLILGNATSTNAGKISTAVGVNGLNITSANGAMQFFGASNGGARLTVPQAAGTAVSVSGGLNVSGTLTADTLTTGTGNVSLNGDVTIATGKSLTQNGTSNVTFGGAVRITNNTTSALNVSGLTTVSGLKVNNKLEFGSGSGVFDLSGITSGTIKLSESGGPTVQYGTLSGGDISCGKISTNNEFTQTGNVTFSTGTGDVTLKGNTTMTGNVTFSTGTGDVTLKGNTTISGSLLTATGKIKGINAYTTNQYPTNTNAGGFALGTISGYILNYAVDRDDRTKGVLFNRNNITCSAINTSGPFPIRLNPLMIAGEGGGKVIESVFYSISGVSGDRVFLNSSEHILVPGMIVTVSGTVRNLSGGPFHIADVDPDPNRNVIYLTIPIGSSWGGTSYNIGAGWFDNGVPTTASAGVGLVVESSANVGLFVSGKGYGNGADTSITASGGLILGNYEGSRPGKISTAVGVNGLNITSANGDMKFFGETGGARLTVPQAAGTAVSVSGGLNVSGTLTADTLTTGTNTVSLNGQVRIANNTTSALNVSGLTTVSGLTVNNTLTANGDVTIAANKNLTMTAGTGIFSTATGNVSLNGPTTLSGVATVNHGGKVFQVNATSVQQVANVSNTTMTRVFSMVGFPSGLYSFNAVVTRNTSTLNAYATGYFWNIPIFYWNGTSFGVSTSNLLGASNANSLLNYICFAGAGPALLAFNQSWLASTSTDGLGTTAVPPSYGNDTTIAVWQNSGQTVEVTSWVTFVHTLT